MIFPLKLDLLMRRHGVNQPALAEAVGVSQKAVSKWANGQARPGYSKMVDVARHFGVSVEVLSDDQRDLPAEAVREAGAIHSSGVTRAAVAGWRRELEGIRDRVDDLLRSMSVVVHDAGASAMAKHFKDLPPTPADRPAERRKTKSS